MTNLVKIPALATGAFMMAAVSASAATLDFTANNDVSGNILGTTWSVSTRVGDSLTNSTHKNNDGCTGQGWDFACAGGNGSYDVGFGANGNGTNNNEIDGQLDNEDEFVEVTFGETLRVLGFAGMLTYDEEDPVPEENREQVKLEYRVGNGAWQHVLAEPLFEIDEDPNSGGNFDTVGLAFKDGLSLFADTVRFRATGVGTSDDDSFNVTAAGLKVAPVPVPAAFPLLLAGLGALGFAARRKKRNTA